MDHRSLRCLGGGLILAVAFGLAGLSIAWLLQPARGPLPLAWDREACGYCRMHIGDRRFAAQLQREGGEAINFDDPGCLFLYLDQHHPKVVELYFQHEGQERWLSQIEVVFRLGVTPTPPMGFGLAATTRQLAPEGVELDAARAWLRARQKKA